MNIVVKNLNDRVKDYYRGERISNALLCGIGGMLLLWTLILYWFRGGNLSTGLLFSSLPLGVFFIISGSYRFVRSLKRYQLSQNRKFLFNHELQHLKDRKERFKMKRKIDQVGVVLGIMLVFCAVFFHWNHYIIASSTSIAIFSAILLAFDLLGQFRTDELLHHLNKKANISET